MRQKSSASTVVRPDNGSLTFDSVLSTLHRQRGGVKKTYKVRYGGRNVRERDRGMENVETPLLPDPRVTAVEKREADMTLRQRHFRDCVMRNMRGANAEMRRKLQDLLHLANAFETKAERSAIMKARGLLFVQGGRILDVGPASVALRADYWKYRQDIKNARKDIETLVALARDRRWAWKESDDGVIRDVRHFEKRHVAKGIMYDLTATIRDRLVTAMMKFVPRAVLIPGRQFNRDDKTARRNAELPPVTMERGLDPLGVRRKIDLQGEDTEGEEKRNELDQAYRRDRKSVV